MVLTAILIGGAIVGVCLYAVIVAIHTLRKIVNRQSEELGKLAWRKPYWVIETDERGVRQISELSARVQELEVRNTPQTHTPDGEPFPSLNPDDPNTPLEIGERT